MANIAAPFGFRSLRHLVGGAIGTNPYTLAAAFATSLFNGDIVKSDGAGNIVLALPGDAILGTFRGCEYIGPDGSVEFRNFWRASTPTQAGTAITAHVEDDPFITLEVQCSTSALYANAGKFVNLVAGAGNLITGMSTMTVGTPGGAASQFQILRIRDTTPMVVSVPTTLTMGPVNVLGFPKDGANCLVEVKAVKHERLGAAAGVAV